MNTEISTAERSPSTTESQPDSTPEVAVIAEQVGKYLDGPSGRLTILEGVSLRVLKGESAAILGVSGSGKSTLLGLLAGLEPASEGRIVIDGQDLALLNDDEHADLRADRVGFVFQNFQLLANLTARENVMLPLDVRGFDRKMALGLVSDALARVGLEQRESHYPSQLSGGEQQRVAIARAYVGQPKVLFADEPTGNLDDQTGKRIEDLLFELNSESDTTLVIVTHNTDFASRCDRCFRLIGGKLCEQPTVTTT